MVATVSERPNAPRIRDAHLTPRVVSATPSPLGAPPHVSPADERFVRAADVPPATCRVACRTRLG